MPVTSAHESSLPGTKYCSPPEKHISSESIALDRMVHLVNIFSYFSTKS